MILKAVKNCRNTQASMFLYPIFINQFLKFGVFFSDKSELSWLIAKGRVSSSLRAYSESALPPRPLNKSRNRFTASLRILTTNESFLHNYLFNKFPSRQNPPKLNIMHFIYLVSGEKKAYAKRPKTLEIGIFLNFGIFITVIRDCS